MTELLCRIFIKDREKTELPSVRGAYGSLAGIVGIIVNILLFVGKIIVGTITSSVAITADAANNLSDAGSSVISLISFKISSKPADREHPFGHARMEYIASMIVSFIILFIGVTLIKDSAEKIFFGGEKTDPSIGAMIVLFLSVLGKLWLYFFNKKLGKKINSSVMKATAADSLSDAISTGAVLAATVVYRIWGVELDAYMGVIVALLILKAGVGIFRESMDSILGKAPEAETVDKIKELIFSFPQVVGIHDMVLHNYGPCRSFLTCHVEVDGKEDIYDSHDAIDNIEKELFRTFGIYGSIHLDPVAVGDPLTDRLKGELQQIVCEINVDMTIHDFRIVPGNTHTNLIFDAVVPFEMKMTDDEIISLLTEKIQNIDQNYFAVVTVERQ